MTSKHPIPGAVLEKHVGILGKTGSGKSNLAKVIAEGLLAAGERVCVVDPTGTWYGLRLARDGKKASPYPVVIFGGAHADLPIGRAHGAEIAEAIGTSSSSVIIDTRSMTVGERTRFFTDFAEALLRKNRGPLHLIIDECHLFMPQGKVADPQSGMMLHAANNLVSLGRGSGLRITMISQRPAKVHKDSLTQIETLIAMRLIAPQDRRAVEDWIGEWADPKEGRELINSLPSLKTGDGWIWSPELGILKREHFPLAGTFDSGRPSEASTGLALAPINVEAIAGKLATVAAEAKANDPKALKARIAELEAQARKAPAPAPVDTKAIEADAYDRGYAEACKSIEAFALRAAAALRDFDASRADLVENLETIAKNSAMGAKNGRPATPASAPARAPAPRRTATPAAAPTDGLSRPQQRILDALRWLESVGIRQADRVRAAMLADQSHRSSGFEKNVSTLRTAGLIDYPDRGTLRLTEAGRASASSPPAPPTTADLHDAIRSKVSGPQWRMLAALIEEYPVSLTRPDLAQRSDQSEKSSGFEKNVSTLRSLGFIDYPSRGEVAALPVLFIEAGV